MPKHYHIDAALMQQIVSALAAQPWGNVNGVMAPLVSTLQEQDALPAPAPEAPAGAPVGGE